MKVFSYVIKDELGIHARPAGNLVKLVKSFPETEITIEKGDRSVKATQLMKIMGMGIKCGDTVKFTFNGKNEEAAEEAIREFMEANL